MKLPRRRKRPYTLKARSEQAAATRARIVEAAVALHEELGPRHTTIKGIAARAGVERLTVYRHFPDTTAIFQACSSAWAGRHPPPDPADWQDAATPLERTRLALAALYAYFRANAVMLSRVHRDLDTMPELAAVTEPFLGYLRSVADQLAAGWRPPAARRVRPLLRHIVRFETWQLLQSAGWPDEQKTDLHMQWIEAVV